MKTLNLKQQFLVSFITSIGFITAGVVLKRRIDENYRFDEVTMLPKAIDWIVDSFRTSSNGTECVLDLTRFSLNPWECLQPGQTQFPPHSNPTADTNASVIICSSLAVAATLVNCLLWPPKLGYTSSTLPKNSNFHYVYSFKLNILIAVMCAAVYSVVLGLNTNALFPNAQCNTLLDVANYAKEILVENGTSYALPFFQTCQKALPLRGTFTLNNFTQNTLANFTLTSNVNPVAAPFDLRAVLPMILILASLSTGLFVRTVALICQSVMKNRAEGRSAFATERTALLDPDNSHAPSYNTH